jgi:2,4-dienoyl-CoA reductase-like NADH-dependent reductase (Old Yellow Enzyme family)
MWHPPQAVKHPLPEAHWPTRDQAARALLFRPIRVGPVELDQRTWVPAMVPWRATEEGFVTSDILDWYERLAEGRPGAIVVEATGVRDVRSGPLLRIGHDRFVPGLEKLVRTVERASAGHTRLFIQILDFLTIRRRPPREKFFRRYLEVTDRHRRRVPGSDDEIREALIAAPDAELEAILTERELEALRHGYRERVTDMHLPHVRDLPRTLPEVFAAAGARAEKAGFDGVELHYAHAYTMASFLSALNDRPDGYGGPRENRARLPLEVYEAVRTSVSPGFAVGCRYLTEDCVKGGSTVDDAVYFGLRFAEAGMDYLSLSRGGRFEDAAQPKVGQAAYPYTGPSGYECMPTVRSDERGPFLRNVPAAARIRSSLREAGHETPVVVSGGIATFGQAEEVLKRGEADVAASARQSLADPDWLLKTRLGRGDEVRRCTFTNYCEALDQAHRKVTCKLWDRKGRNESGVPLSGDGRRRLVAPRWRPAAHREESA